MNAKPAAGSGVWNRAVAASSALVVGAVAVTGVFVAKIARGYAAPSHAGTVSGGTGSGGIGDQSNPFGDDGSGNSIGTGGQVSQPQYNQPPVGSSHGS